MVRVQEFLLLSVPVVKKN